MSPHPVYIKNIVVEGLPEPQPRVKAFVKGAHASVYTPKGPWQAWAQRVYLCSGGAPQPPHDGPVRLDITYRMPMPASMPKRLQIDGSLCWRKPDIDNLTKLVMDQLQARGWYTDDGRVAILFERKVYSRMPGMHITITQLESGSHDICDTVDPDILTAATRKLRGLGIEGKI